MYWNEEAKAKFDKIMLMVPVMYRMAAEKHAKMKAEDIASARGASVVEECHIVSAFVKETPASLQAWMLKKAEKVGFNMEASFVTKP